MKKIKRLLTILLVGLFMICMSVSLSGCWLSKIEVGVNDGVVYFTRSKQIPKMVLLADEKIVIEDSEFFEKLVNCIDGKPNKHLTYCNGYCESLYVVEIGKYDFALHSNHILIFSPLGYNIKGVEIIEIECSETEMQELFDILRNIEQR